MKSLLMLAGLGLVAATPALAVREPKPDAAPVAVASVAPNARSAPAKATRYCVLDAPTGTRIQTKTCHTRDEWLALGSDPLAK